MSKKDELISIALNEVGYVETPTNVNKYAADMDALAGWYNYPKNGFAWCAIFCDWCFVQAFGRATATKMLYHEDTSAGCFEGLRSFKNAGAFYSSPEIGDIIFYRNGDTISHQGIVYAVDSAFVYSVEGNYGDKVKKRVNALNMPDIVGYGRPDWSALNDEQISDSADLNELISRPAAQVKYPMVQYGDDSPWVCVLQAFLNALGYDCGEIDGEFGILTLTALKKYQKSAGLESDGICGASTWNSFAPMKV